MDRPRFFAKRDKGATWSVVDRSDGRVAEMRGVLLVGLGEELAVDMAKLLVLEHHQGNPDERE